MMVFAFNTDMLENPFKHNKFAYSAPLKDTAFAYVFITPVVEIIKLMVNVLYDICGKFIMLHVKLFSGGEFM